MKRFLIIFKLLLVSLIFASNTNFDAGSLTVIAEESGKEVNVTDNSSEDYLAGGNIVTFSGVADDIYLMGRKVIMSGKSNGGFFGFAETFTMDGSVDNNFHSAAGNVRINGMINGTSFIAAEDIIISENSKINGTLFSVSNTLHVIGALNNGLNAGAGEIIIDGPVTGDVNIKTGNIIITERGSISGNLTYSSSKELTISEKERVNGSITFEADKRIKKEKISTIGIIITIIIYLSFLVSGLLFLLIPGIKDNFSEGINAQFLVKKMLWGLIPIFVYPVLMVITIPLLPISFILGLLLLPLLWICGILGVLKLSQFLFDLVNWNSASAYIKFLLTGLIYIALAQIPFVKTLIVLGITAIGSGFLLGKIFRKHAI